jgi:phage antirepressor YoqD-like protein
MSAKRLNKILYREKVQRLVGYQWILYAEHMNKGYTKSETIHYERSDGTFDTKILTKWTQKGRLFINDILNRRGVFANVDKAPELDFQDAA